MKHLKLSVLVVGLFAFALQQAHCGMKKFNAGHYVAVGAGFNLRDIEGLESDALVGVNKRYLWSELEPKKGEYDFSEIRKDLKYLKSINKRLVVFFTDKTFFPQSKHPVPNYMRHASMVNHVKGITTLKWHPEVIERQIILCQKMSEEFDDNIFFEGFAYQESAPSIAYDKLDAIGYTPELLRDGLIELLQGSADAFPNSRIFWYMNFIPRKNEYLYDIADATYPYGVVMGGPDILPYRASLERLEKLYTHFKGRMALFCSAQSDSYRHHKLDTNNNTKRRFHVGEVPIHPDGYLTPEEIFFHGRDKYHLDYIFWSYKTYQMNDKRYPGDPNDYVFADALKVIEKYSDFNAKAK
ncbi:MAG: hypothetical protein AB3N63_19300 [Puniceicoccaceae bacterium]